MKKVVKNRNLPVGKVILGAIFFLLLIFEAKSILALQGLENKKVEQRSSNEVLEKNPSTASSQSTEVPAAIAPSQSSASSAPAKVQVEPTYKKTFPIIGQLKINSTPTGFLNIRSEDSVSSSVVARAYPGQIYSYVKNQNGWYMIDLKNNLYGWVDGQYVIAMNAPAVPKAPVIRAYNDDNARGDDD